MEERNLRKTRVGIVVSDKMDKTITVAIQDNVRHPLYNKIVKKTYKLKAHDENNECKIGDKVKVKVTAIKDGKLSLSIKEASDMMAKEIEEEVYEVPDAGQQATTSLGSLFANIKLD